MPSPKGDLTLLCQNLQATVALLGFAQVLPGKNKLAASGAPTRIVMFPVGSKNGTADDRTVSVTSGWMLFTAHCWALDPDNAFDLRERFFQALRIQADAGGYYWKSPDSEDERWDIQPDTAQQGQEFEIDVLVRLDVSLPESYLTRGTVGSTGMNRTATLTADMGPLDNACHVDATFGAPASGFLYIGDEKMSYASYTPGRFAGLARGLGGTTAAAHSSGAAVYVSTT
jgi:hypothetical protein